MLKSSIRMSHVRDLTMVWSSGLTAHIAWFTLAWWSVGSACFDRASRGFALHFANALQRPKHTSQGDHKDIIWDCYEADKFNNCTHRAPLLHPLAILCYINYHQLAMFGFVEPYGGPCQRYCARFTRRKWRMSMRVRNIAAEAGLAPWLSNRLDSTCRTGLEEDPSSNCFKRFFSYLMSWCRRSPALHVPLRLPSASQAWSRTLAGSVPSVSANPQYVSHAVVG